MAPRGLVRRDDGRIELREPLLLPNAAGSQRAPRTDTDGPASDAVSSGERAVSPNVRLVKLYTIVAFAGRSIWNQNVLATFVYLLRNGDAESVGYITACMGLAQMLISFPSGFLADRYRRDTMLRFASLFGGAAVVTTVVATRQSSYPCLVLALVFWGLYWGVVNTALDALFADSINDGDRAKHFTSRSIHLQFGNLTGPVICLLMFVYLGDTWTLEDCTTVLTAGQIVSVPGILLLWLLSDDRTGYCAETTEASAAAAAAAAPTPATSVSDTAEEDPSRSLLCASPPTDPEANEVEANGDEVCETIEDDNVEQNGCCGLSRQRRIPLSVAASDILSGLASGMSIRYIAIFLYDDIKLSPATVQVIYILNPMYQSVLMKTAEYLSTKFGRCQVAVAFKWIGISLMLSMIGAYKTGMSRWLVCALLVTRTGFMNSTRALTKSVVMDNVPRAERAKWSALESVNMFSWSGSAVLGGILVGMHGIIFNFCVTAALQFMATFPIISLFALIDPRSDAETVTSGDDDDDDENAGASPTGYGDSNRGSEADEDDVDPEGNAS